LFLLVQAYRQGYHGRASAGNKSGLSSMAKKLNSVLGVDIGSRYIKVAEMRTQGKEPMVTAMGMMDTPEGAVDHTGVFNPEAVGQALKQAIQSAGSSCPNVIVSIAGQASVLVRTLEVPRMNATELREHMQWEINRNIPFSESNVVSDYRPLADEDPNSANMEVVMAISPQSAIDTIIAAIKQAKKTPAAIDVEPLSIARSMTYSFGEEFQGQTVCFVDMGHKTTAINIYRDGKLLMPRQIPVGGEMITKALADHLNLPAEEAEKLKMEKCEVPVTAGQDTGFGGFDMGGGGGFSTPTLAGNENEFQPYNPFADSNTPFTPMGDTTQQITPDPNANPFQPTDLGAIPDPNSPAVPNPFEPTHDPFATQSMPAATPDPTQAAPHDQYAMPAAVVDPEVEKLYQIIAPVLDEFVAEVRRSVDYFRSRGGDINRIVMAGGGAKLKGLTEFVGRSLAMDCAPYDCFHKINLNGKKIAPGYAEENSQDFVVAVGNALHIFFD
jgi:type IV pilus assembly protein PilM